MKYLYRENLGMFVSEIDFFAVVRSLIERSDVVDKLVVAVKQFFYWRCAEISQERHMAIVNEMESALAALAAFDEEVGYSVSNSLVLEKASITMDKIRAFLGPDVDGVVWQPSPEHLVDWLRACGVEVEKKGEVEEW